ncbi:hypothetical protein CPLU01_13992 [Colletotrichum plurivorum]|uniref:Uncharacterized protein n=1 Tax=Colletotrichum plurivorum TaxID=2175906 RepID=A0A8H6JNP4_9PEZI|nr:hypothetical protein CPLU01_13992 [Colletotrichum plurivorum]
MVSTHRNIISNIKHTTSASNRLKASKVSKMKSSVLLFAAAAAVLVAAAPAPVPVVEQAAAAPEGLVERQRVCCGPCGTITCCWC